MIETIETGNVFYNGKHYIAIGEIRSSGVVNFSFGKNRPTGIPDKLLNPMSNKDALTNHLKDFEYTLYGKISAGPKEETLFNIDDL